MRKRGKGPRDVLVRKHAKWLRGDRRRVENHLRGADPKRANKHSDDQCVLDLR